MPKVKVKNMSITLIPASLCRSEGEGVKPVLPKFLRRFYA